MDNNGLKVDADSYLKDHSVEELKTILNNAVSGTVFRFNRINEEAMKEQDENGILYYRYLNEFKRKTIELSNRNTVLPTDRDIVFKMFSESTGNIITKEAIEEEANRLKGIEDKKMQRLDTLRTLSTAYTLANSDDPDGVNKALSLIGDKVSRLKEISREADYQKLLSLPSEETIKERFKERPTGIPTNYYFGTGDKREKLLLQSGALTYICAPTSHGKSRMLENLAIQLSTDGESGDVIYFTFEEDTEAVRMQLLNVYIGEDLSKNNIRSLNSYYRDGKNYFYKDTYKQNLFKTKEAEFMKIITSGKLRVFSEDYDSNDLIGSIRYLSRSIKIKAVFIDYIQLLHTRGAGAGRKEELADMCRGFMTLAKDTGLPIVLAAQLNREAYSPIEMTAQNIAEASEIEHSANTIMVLWNSVNEPLQKSGYFYRDKTGNRPTEESSKLEKRGFNIGTEGKLYAKLVKNRAGARNIDAIFDFNGNSGKITQTDNDPKTFKEEEEPFNSSDNAENNGLEIF
jgi:replicative DNA helicase